MAVNGPPDRFDERPDPDSASPEGEIDAREPAGAVDAPDGATAPPVASGWSDDLKRHEAIIRSFRDPRTRWTAITACLALVIFPLIMLLGLIAILVLPSPG